MKNNYSKKTIALLAAAAILFAGGSFTATRAALNIFSPEHFLEFETSNQAVRLLENGSPVGADNPLLSTLEGKVKLGKTYKEEISAKNKSDVSQFVRIVLRKYWLKPDGSKATEFEAEDLDKIDLVFTNQDMWLENKQEETAERKVFYYKNSVPAGDGPESVTVPLTATIKVDSSIASKYMTEPVIDPENMPVDQVITYVYDFDGYKICLEAEAQSIQTHNAQDAVISLWGVTNVTVSGSTLSVAN